MCTLKPKNTTLENHFTSNETVQKFEEYILNDYKYGELLDLPKDNQTTYPHLDEQCTVSTLIKYEDEFEVKYMITDKLLGIAIVDKIILNKISKKEINKILIPVTYEHDPIFIKNKAREFIYKHQHILHNKAKCQINHSQIY